MIVWTSFTNPTIKIYSETTSRRLDNTYEFMICKIGAKYFDEIYNQIVEQIEAKDNDNSY